MPKLMKIFKFIGTTSVFFFALAILVLAVSIVIALYQSARKVTTEDMELVEKSLTRVETTLKDDGDWDQLSRDLKKTNEQSQITVEKLKRSRNLDTQSQQGIIASLNDLVLNLTIIQNRMSIERRATFDAVSGLRKNISDLKGKLQPATPLEKFIATTGEQVGKIFAYLAWPLLALAIFWYLIKSRSAPYKIAELLSPFKSVKLFGTEFVLSEETKERVEETFERYRTQVVREYDAWVQKKTIEERLKVVMPEVIRLINEARGKLNPPKGHLGAYRCTIHVPDLLFAETFYQLLDYYPGRPGGETRGRIRSIRFGIIGKAWRLGESQVVGTVPTNTVDSVSNWGMTTEEAAVAAQDRQSFLCVLLRHQKVGVGLLYMDAKEAHEFGEDNKKDLLDAIEKICGDDGLTEALGAIDNDLRGRGPLIRIYKR